MYLKRLESAGFKSFAERIRVDFVPGITAVVGPNGSGKSNITDAIRWVLGEQSAKSLRGSKMEDVIFQGSDSRNPLNIAEVTLILDNSDDELPLDYEEISVTRRVYRSGESEFYLNKQACRMKDIIDLFMDSGLGRESFSIISQGNVEEILSSRADERRTIFEEAAGVLKYKQRKRQAESKLEETEENLNRVEDIIHEIEQQIEPLRNQRDTANQYLHYKNELQQKEISLLVTEIEDLHADWESLLAELENDREHEGAMKTAIQKREAQLEKDQTDVADMDNTINELQERLLALATELEQSEGNKRLLQERIKHYDENKNKLEADKTHTSERIETIRKTWQEEKQILDSLTSDSNETKERMRTIENRLQETEEDITEKIEELKSEYIECLNKQAAYKNEKQTVLDRLEQLDEKKERQDDLYQESVQERDRLEKALDDSRKQLQLAEDSHRSGKEALDRLKTSRQDARSQYDRDIEKLHKGYRTLDKLKSKQEMLQGMKEEFQGFYRGVKTVLEARDEQKLQGIHGAVIELIDIPKDYAQAMESVLGGQSQHVVISDEQRARQAISWLKKKNSGRATFLPLSTIKPRFVPERYTAKMKGHQGYIGIAADLVSSSDTYRHIVKHLMGHVVVARSLADANELAVTTDRKHRIVTLEGDVVSPGGSMSGGARKKNNQSLFTREKDLQEVTEQLEEYQERTDTFEKNIAKQKEHLEQQDEKIKRMEEEQSGHQQELEEMRSSTREIELQLASRNDELQRLDQDQREHENDRRDLRERHETLDAELRRAADELKRMDDELEQLSAKESTYKEDEQKMKEELQHYQVTLAEQEEKRRNQAEKTESLAQQLQDLNTHLESLDTELQELIHAHENDETEDEMDHAIAEKQQEKAQQTEKVQQLRENRLNKTQHIEQEERELKEENKQHQHYLQAIQANEVKANRLDVELDNRLNKLQSDYTITYEKAYASYGRTDDTEETKQQVADLKQQIKELGNVNLGAIDEYERISERYTFLREQEDDLLEAKETLRTVIREMDDEMRVRFETTFNQIKEEFTVVFQELFEGGKAKLSLTDPDQMLETGIDIIAQPPGKKLQHLGLLSGGERALTAIALLFAILRVRPVPFCVLDEVEAALDEANVIRFSKYINMYSANTQFIVITHRKGTMEAADVLYGVTMQESGVSRLVSVKMEETNKLMQA